MKEITFQIENDEIDGGWIAKAIGQGITTQAESEEELKEMIVDAVKCHFDTSDVPGIIHLHFLKKEILKI